MEAGQQIFLLNMLTFRYKLHIILITEPDTPLNDAYHVGSFNYWEILCV